MNTGKIVGTMGVLLGVAGLSVAWRESTESRDVTASYAALRREHDKVQARLVQLGQESRAAEQRARMSEERLAALQGGGAAPERGGKVANGSAVKAGAATTGPTSGSAASVNQGMEIMANPEYVRLSVEKFRLGLPLQYGPLYKALGLTPEQIAKFEANRLEYQQTTQDMWSSAVAKGVSVNDPGLMGLVRDSLTALEKDLRGVLGDAGYRQFSAYNRAQSGMEVVSTLAGNLYHTDTPLSGSQGDQLAQAVLGSSRMVPIAPDSKTTRNEVDWNAVLAQARAVLAPSQLATFETVIAGKKIQQQMSALSSANRAATATTTAPVTKPGS